MEVSHLANVEVFTWSTLMAGKLVMETVVSTT